MSFLAALTAVVVAVGAGLSWLEHHASYSTVMLVGVGLCVIAWGGMRTLWSELDLRSRLVVRLASLGCYVAIVAEANVFPKHLVIDYLILGMAVAVPVVWGLYEVDQALHKTCPDCAERVKLAARICRYCRHDFEPPSELESARARRAA